MYQNQSDQVLFFLLWTTIRPKIMFLMRLISWFAHDHSTKIYGPLSFIISFIYNQSNKYDCPHWLISFIWTQPFGQNIWSSFIYSFFCVPLFIKIIRVLIDLFILFVHQHSTKIRGHSYSLVYFFLNCANTLYAAFKEVLPLFSSAAFMTVPLYSVLYIYCTPAFKFCRIYTWQYCPYILCTILMTVLSLHLVRFVHGYSLYLV